MTLLDYFAGQALAGRTANGPLLQHMEDEEVPEDVAVKAYARHAYKIAAAMLAERERLTSPPLHP